MSKNFPSFQETVSKEHGLWILCDTELRYLKRVAYEGWATLTFYKSLRNVLKELKKNSYFIVCVQGDIFGWKYVGKSPCDSKRKLKCKRSELQRKLEKIKFHSDFFQRKFWNIKTFKTKKEREFVLASKRNGTFVTPVWLQQATISNLIEWHCLYI